MKDYMYKVIDDGEVHRRVLIHKKSPRTWSLDLRHHIHIVDG